MIDKITPTEGKVGVLKNLKDYYLVSSNKDLFRTIIFSRVDIEKGEYEIASFLNSKNADIIVIVGISEKDISHNILNILDNHSSNIKYVK